MVEIFAAILIAISLGKIIVVTLNWRWWIDFMKRFYASPKIVSWVSLVLAVSVLYGLLSSGLTIVQILAVCLFLVLIFLIGVAPYARPVISWAEGQDLATVLNNQWLYILVWIVLLAWGTLELALY